MNKAAVDKPRRERRWRCAFWQRAQRRSEGQKKFVFQRSWDAREEQRASPRRRITQGCIEGLEPRRTCPEPSHVFPKLFAQSGNFVAHSFDIRNEQFAIGAPNRLPPKLHGHL